MRAKDGVLNLIEADIFITTCKFERIVHEIYILYMNIHLEVKS